jgi:hypothetical protein
MDLENTRGEPILGTIDQVPLGLEPSTHDVPLLASPLPAYGTPVVETLLFFLSAVGCTIGCTAVLSNLVFYSDTLGLDSFLFLNVAVFAPMLPVTLAQALWDAKFYRRFQSLKSFLFRGTVGFFVTLLCLLLLPWASQSLVHLTVTSVFLGLSSAVLHGHAETNGIICIPTLRSIVSIGQCRNAGFWVAGIGCILDLWFWWMYQ